jgi:N-methylhydantoinase A
MRGGDAATVTDANLLRGVIRATSLAGGSLTLDPAASSRVLADLGERLGVSPDHAADAVVRVVEANMIQAIRLVSTRRGHDPRDYVLVAFGGAGPIHAASIAGELGIGRVLVPAFAGVLSAFGLLVADVARDYVQTAVAPLDELGAADVGRRFAALAERAVAEFAGHGIPAGALSLRLSCDARYQGQAYELSVPVTEAQTEGPAIAAMFHRIHAQRYGFAFEAEKVEIVNYRAKAVVANGPSGVPIHRITNGAGDPQAGEILVGGARRTARFFRGESLQSNATLRGPAVIEDASSTCFVPDGWTASLRDDGAILLERADA